MELQTFGPDTKSILVVLTSPEFFRAHDLLVKLKLKKLQLDDFLHSYWQWKIDWTEDTVWNVTSPKFVMWLKQESVNKKVNKIQISGIYSL